MFLDYNQLVSDYYKNLDENLRGFRGGPGFLETWTHDENHDRSISQILDLAEEHKVEVLLLKVGEEICNNAQLGACADGGGVLTRKDSTTLQFLSRRAVDILGRIMVAAQQLMLTNEFTITNLKGPVVTLSYTEKNNEFSFSMIQLERIANSMSPERIVLQSENMEDKNRRHLH